MDKLLKGAKPSDPEAAANSRNLAQIGLSTGANADPTQLENERIGVCTRRQTRLKQETLTAGKNLAANRE